MARTVAVSVKAFKESSVTDDGLHGLFKFTANSGDFTLAIPHDQLMHVMAALSTAAGRSNQILQQDDQQKHAFPCEWWQFGLDQSGQWLVLSFRMPGGMELSFRFPRDRASMMRETLETLEKGGATGLPPGTVRQ